MAPTQSLSVVMRVRNGVMEAQAALPALFDGMQSSTPNNDDGLASEGDPRRKKHKTTYRTRKEEISALQAEQDALSSKIEQLQREKTAHETTGLVKAIESHALLLHELHQSSLFIAGTRSLVTSTQEHNPLYTFIHVASADKVERQRSLEIIREAQMQKATEYIVERVRLQNLRRSTRQTETNEAHNGDFLFTQFDVTPFKGTRSVETVYEHLQLFLRHQEFIIWENLDISSILDVDSLNEETEEKEPRGASQLRMVSTLLGDVVMEKNVAVFRGLYQDGTDALPMPHALVVLESIDVDDAHPYDPSNRLRIDLSCVMLILMAPRGEEGDAEPTVSLVRCSFQRLHEPTYGIPEEKKLRLHQLIPQWGDVLCQSVCEFVALNIASKTANPLVVQ